MQSEVVIFILFICISNFYVSKYIIKKVKAYIQNLLMFASNFIAVPLFFIDLPNRGYVSLFFSYIIHKKLQV